MTSKAVIEMTAAEELKNRIDECDKALWTCDETIRKAIYENVSNELLAMLRAAKKCKNNTSSQLAVFHKLGHQLFEDTEAYLEAQATELECGLLPE